MYTQWELELHARHMRERAFADADAAAQLRLATAAMNHQPGRRLDGLRRYLQRFSPDGRQFSPAPVLYQVSACGDQVRR